MEENKYKEAQESFSKLLTIMDELREKCPWDRKQTNLSLKSNTIEEVYELAQAIEDNDYQEIKKELGDLLLHIVFYSKIGSESGEFDIKAVIDSLCEKLIRRHPHIYGEVKVENAEDVKKTWEQIKMTEGRTSVFSGVPRALDSLIKAYRLQEKAAGVGFDWEKKEQVWEKVKEELQELEQEVEGQNSQEKIEEEFGDVLFALINYARFLKIKPEHALEKTNRKFIKRFQYIEQVAQEKNKKLQEMSLEEMDIIWNNAKTMEE
ncbi:MAG: nucleoside triphosphate pyrophosphohydrolase [Bacteroidales bacterium]|nr:nucleoside triphosphate pyrophosphohydrolase [Bacteroidales bacterium]MEE1251666.1 nucleoside triphosphate pyrophosphohydrolase [Bacteroidales bacterium]